MSLATGDPLDTVSPGVGVALVDDPVGLAEVTDSVGVAEVGATVVVVVAVAVVVVVAVVVAVAVAVAVAVSVTVAVGVSDRVGLAEVLGGGVVLAVLVGADAVGNATDGDSDDAALEIASDADDRTSDALLDSALPTAPPPAPPQPVRLRRAAVTRTAIALARVVVICCSPMVRRTPERPTLPLDAYDAEVSRPAGGSTRGARRAPR